MDFVPVNVPAFGAQPHLALGVCHPEDEDFSSRVRSISGGWPCRTCDVVVWVDVSDGMRAGCVVHGLFLFSRCRVSGCFYVHSCGGVCLPTEL